jgi:hypothetical protein
MPVDLPAAKHFLADAARVVDRHRFAALFEDGPADAVATALRAYRNEDGGFGHALEPDLRVPWSQPAATLYALEMLHESGRFEGDLVDGALGWIESIANERGGIPFAVGDLEGWPVSPWFTAEPDSQLTAGLAAICHAGGVTGNAWLDAATDFCWREIEERPLSESYRWKYLVMFLDHVPDAERAQAALDRIREPLLSSGVIGLDPAADKEQLTPLDFCPDPTHRSRSLFPDDLVERHLDAMEAGQLDDGGWMFDWLAWSTGGTVEWRGVVTLRALTTLRAYARL